MSSVVQEVSVALHIAVLDHGNKQLAASVRPNDDRRTQRRY